MPDITQNLGLKKPLGNENVTRSAYNENLEIIDQNVSKKSDLAAHLAEYTSQEAKTYYLDQASGSDINDGLTAETAFATWEKVAGLIPERIRHSYIIKVIGNYMGMILLSNKVMAAGGTLFIEGNTTTPDNQTVFGNVSIQACLGHQNVISQNGIVFRYFRTTGIFTCKSCVGVEIRNCEPRNPNSTGLLITHSLMAVLDCDFGNSVVQDAIVVQRQSTVYSENNTGNVTRYGIRSELGSTVGKSGTQPTGTTTNEYLAFGGTITPGGYGGIVESVSNANGEWIRFANGTQICIISNYALNGVTIHSARNGLYVSNFITIIHPASFILSPSIITTVLRENARPAWWAGGTSSNNSQTINVHLTLYCNESITLNEADKVSILAIGRWK